MLPDQAPPGGRRVELRRQKAERNPSLPLLKSPWPLLIQWYLILHITRVLENTIHLYDLVLHCKVLV